MTSGRRFATWNILDSAVVRNPNGHHYWENKELIDELLRRGETVRLVSHLAAPSPEQFSGVRVIPAFSLFPYHTVSDDERWATLENFIVHNRTFAADLAKLDPSLFHNSMVLFPTISAGQLLGIFRWLSTFRGEHAPKAAICLLPTLEWSNSDHTTGLYKTVWKHCPPELRKRVAILARTPQIAQLFATHTGMPAHVYPYPIPQELVEHRPQARASDDNMGVSFVAGARKERGGEFIADVVRRCSGLGVRFFIQVRQGGDTNIDESLLSALSGLPYVRLHEGALERSDYYREIADSVVLLAYEPDAYRWRDSGVYHEALFLDAPVLVTAETFMADEVKSAGNGLVIEEFSTAAIVDCIARAQRELPALKAAAMRVGREARASQGVARCIDTIAGLFA